ncbi:MAG: hypothetical protein SFW67_19895 [Myxococcaceae bacterium]|nr:hypothetical protein [Myxococcaceae bacterium]
MSRLLDGVLKGVGRLADGVVQASAPAAVSWLTVPAAWMPLAPLRRDVFIAEGVDAPRPTELPVGLDVTSAAEAVLAGPGPRGRLLSWERRWTPPGLAATSPLRARPLVVVRHWAAPNPKAQLLLVSGFNMGWGFLDAVVLQVRWFVARGYSVTLLGLPLHGSEALVLGPPAWPSVDLELTRDAVALATHDVRSAVAWLRAQHPAPVVVLGVSLGAWPAALAATAPGAADVFAALTPMVDYPRLLLDHRPPWVSRGAITRLAASLEPVSPLSRPPAVQPGRVRVFAASEDHVTPAGHHAGPLAAHFGVEVTTFPGSHLVPRGLKSAWASLDVMVEATGTSR